MPDPPDRDLHVVTSISSLPGVPRVVSVRHLPTGLVGRAQSMDPHEARELAFKALRDKLDDKALRDSVGDAGMTWRDEDPMSVDSLGEITRWERRTPDE